MISSKYYIQEATLKSMTDVLREKYKIANKIKTKDIPSYISGLISLTAYDELLTNTASEIYNNTVSNIKSYCFVDNTLLSSAEFTKVTDIGSYTFSGCTSLEYLSLPLLSSYGTNAFSKCTNLKEVNIGVSAVYSSDSLGLNFVGNTNLKSITFPNCTHFYSYTCKNCTSLEYISFPNLVMTNLQAFYGCTSLKEIEIPQTSTIGTQTFAACTSLEKVIIPNVASVWPSAFYNCPNLKELYAPLLTSYSTTPFGTPGVSTGGGNLSWESVTAGFTTVPALWSNLSNLVYVSMSNAIAVAANAFKNCTSLSDIYNIGNTYKETVNISATYYHKTYGTRTYNVTENFFMFLSNITYNGGAFYNTNIKSIQWLGKVENIIPSSIMYSTSLGSNYIAYSQFNLSSYTTDASLPTLSQITINANAFLNCSLLSFIDIDSPVSLLYNAFSNCTALTEVRLRNLTSWGMSAAINPFLGCTSLLSLTLSGLSTIPGSAFNTLTGLTNVKLINVKVIGSSAFLGCINLNSFSDIGNSISTIYTAAFKDCTSLDDSIINNMGITSGNLLYAQQAFMNNTGIINLTKNGEQDEEGNNLLNLEIRLNTFANCTNLDYVALDKVNTSLMYGAFSSCTALGLVRISNLTSYGVSSGVHPFNGCTALSRLEIGGTLTTIPQSAFINLIALESVCLWDASIIGIKALYNCKSLTYVSIPKVEKLYASAFAHCSVLSSITLPMVNNISATAFGSCINLMSLTLTASSVATLANANAFVNTPLSISTLTGSFGSIYVPTSLYNSYIAATNWKTYSARIVAI